MLGIHVDVLAEITGRLLQSKILLDSSTSTKVSPIASCNYLSTLKRNGQVCLTGLWEQLNAKYRKFVESKTPMIANSTQSADMRTIINSGHFS